MARICAEPGCPAVIYAGSRCTTHTRATDRRRGTRQQRGYDTHHDRLRNQWAPRVATGTVACARCGQPIRPGQTWALDHSDDRTHYLGPSHAHCNNSAGGKAAHH